MARVDDLLKSEGLGKLIKAQECLDQSLSLYDEVFEQDGAPAEVESEQEAVCNTIVSLSMHIAHLMGYVVHHALFPLDGSK